MQFKCGDMYYSTGGATTDPQVWVAWDEAALGTTDVSPASASAYDVFDSNDNQWTLTETPWDSTNGSATVDQANGGGASTNLCTEQWKISNTSAVCVKTKGGASRPWTAVDDEDIDFDYVVYSITTMIGDALVAGDADKQFTAISVDFATFQESETASATTLFPTAMLFLSAVTFFASYF